MNESTRDFTRLTLRSSSPILILSTRSFRRNERMEDASRDRIRRRIRNGIFAEHNGLIRFNLLMDLLILYDE